MPQIQLVVFDCDGTLLDTQHAIVKSLTECFADHGLPEPDPSIIRRNIGAALPKVLQQLLPPGADVDLDELQVSYRMRFIGTRMVKDYVDPLYPGCVEALDALAAKGVALGLITNQSQAGLKESLGPHGILERFAAIETTDTGLSKPDPELLRRAMADADVDPQATVMVGDSVRDVAMAVGAKARAIGVTWGYNMPEELEKAGAVAVLTEFGQLLPTLREHGL